MQINVTYGASVSGAPAGFTTAVDAAVAFFESTFDANITVNITFGWGEVGGEPLDPGALGESLTQYVRTPFVVSEQALFNADKSPATTDALVRLRMLRGRTTGWSDADIFELPYAQARILGQAPTVPGVADGYIGLDSTASYTFDPNNRAVAGKYDAIGVIEHEISEVLGRQAFDGQQPPGGLASHFTLLDLFRYSAPGVHTYEAGPSYFSLNGDQLLLPFNDPSNGGDAGDWSQAVSGDASDAFAETGIALQVSTVDLRVLELLGYHLSPNAPTPNGTPVTPLVFTQNLQLNAGQTLNFDGPLALV
ncbi:MAG TPA: NF038122 family metalloprotease, partial [Rhizomicrobium sp.]|nr:NF038122 family metalloprotease [Rhizomicrobium sp.]